MAYSPVIALCVHFIVEETIEFRLDTEIGREGLGLDIGSGMVCNLFLRRTPASGNSHSE